MAKPNKPASGGRKPFGGMTISPDQALALIVGQGPLTPSEMIKNLWGYIKRKRLVNR